MKRIEYRFFLIVLLSVLAVEVFPVSAQEGSWFDEGNYDEEWLDKNFDNDVMIISTPEEFAAFGEYMTRPFDWRPIWICRLIYGKLLPLKIILEVYSMVTVIRSAD